MPTTASDVLKENLGNSFHYVKEIEKGAIKRIHMEHDYLATGNSEPSFKRRKNTDNDISDIYKETVGILKNIENAVTTGFKNLTNTINERLTAIQKTVESQKI